MKGVQGTRSVAVIALLSGALFLAGVARACAWRATGKPHLAQRGLLAIELAAPPLAVLTQASVAQLLGRDQTTIGRWMKEDVSWNHVRLQIVPQLFSLPRLVIVRLLLFVPLAVEHLGS